MHPGETYMGTRRIIRVTEEGRSGDRENMFPRAVMVKLKRIRRVWGARTPNPKEVWSNRSK